MSTATLPGRSRSLFNLAKRKKSESPTPNQALLELRRSSQERMRLEHRDVSDDAERQIAHTLIDMVGRVALITPAVGISPRKHGVREWAERISIPVESMVRTEGLGSVALLPFLPEAFTESTGHLKLFKQCSELITRGFNKTGVEARINEQEFFETAYADDAIARMGAWTVDALAQTGNPDGLVILTDRRTWHDASRVSLAAQGLDEAFCVEKVDGDSVLVMGEVVNAQPSWSVRTH